MVIFDLRKGGVRCSLKLAAIAAGAYMYWELYRLFIL